ncbi:MAG: hypothetical protein WB783_05070 [Arenicellales bacterium]
MMNAPFGFLGTTIQWTLFACFLAASVAIFQALKNQGAQLEGSVPCGILAIEMPWDSDRAQHIVAQWNKDNLLGVARTQIKYDFLFLLLYPVAFSLICGLLGSYSRSYGWGGLASFGAAIAWIVLLAGLFDALENTAISKMLSGSTGFPIPQIATIAAGTKFTLLIVAIGYVVMDLLFLVRDHVKL